MNVLIVHFGSRNLEIVYLRITITSALVFSIALLTSVSAFVPTAIALAGISRHFSWLSYCVTGDEEEGLI